MNKLPKIGGSSKFSEAELEKKGFDDVLKRRLKIIEQLKDDYEIFPLRMGHYVLGLVGGATTFSLLNTYRRYLHMGNKGLLASLALTTVIPSAVLAAMQETSVRYHIIAKPVMCPVCYEIRSVAYQLLMSCAYPIVACSTFTMFLARSYSTAALPNVTHYNEAWAFFRKMNRSVLPQMKYSLVVATVTPLVMVYLQFRGREKVIMAEKSLKPRTNLKNYVLAASKKRDVEALSDN